jgi:hypothetical protein
MTESLQSLILNMYLTKENVIFQYWYGELFFYYDLDCVDVFVLNVQRYLCNVPPFPTAAYLYFYWSISSHHQQTLLYAILYKQYYYNVDPKIICCAIEKCSWSDTLQCTSLIITENRSNILSRVYVATIYKTGYWIDSWIYWIKIQLHTYNRVSYNYNWLSQLSHNSCWVSSGSRTSCRPNWLLLAIN